MFGLLFLFLLSFVEDGVFPESFGSNIFGGCCSSVGGCLFKK